jgi:hypothetical protein
MRGFSDGGFEVFLRVFGGRSLLGERVGAARPGTDQAFEGITVETMESERLPCLVRQWRKRERKEKLLTSLLDHHVNGVELIHMVCESAVVELSLGLACSMRAGMGVGLVGATFGGAGSHVVDGR